MVRLMLAHLDLKIVSFLLITHGGVRLAMIANKTRPLGGLIGVAQAPGKETIRNRGRLKSQAGAEAQGSPNLVLKRDLGERIKSP